MLLANNGALPLRASQARKLALIGPNADRLAIMGGGSARVKAHYRLSLPDVLRDRLGADAEIRAISGTGPIPDDWEARDRLDADRPAGRGGRGRQVGRHGHRRRRHGRPRGE